MKKAISPCYKCADRKVGCHSTCELYQEYAGVMADIRKERYEEHIKKSKLVSKKREKEVSKRKGEV